MFRQTRTHTRRMIPDRSTGQTDQSSIIIHVLKEEIGRFQEILLNRITKLEKKCDPAHEQQAVLIKMNEKKTAA